MKAIEKKDILNYRFLSNIRYAPGGERAAFVVAGANEEENCYEQRLWLYEKGELRQLTDLGKEGRFTWLDENRLLFPAVRSAREKKRTEGHEEFTAYYVLDLRGGEALPFMTLPFAAGKLRVLDENTFAVAGTVDKRHPALYAADEEEKAKVRKQREEEKDYEVFDELPWYFNGAGVTNGQRERLFLVKRERGALLCRDGGRGGEALDLCHRGQALRPQREQLGLQPGPRRGGAEAAAAGGVLPLQLRGQRLPPGRRETACAPGGEPLPPDHPGGGLPPLPHGPGRQRPAAHREGGQHRRL